MPIELFIVSILRALVEVAGLSLLGQGAVALLSGKYRDQNIFYKLFQIVTRPVIKAARVVAPRVIIDAHVPFLAFFILFWLWIALAFAKRQLCGLHGLAC
jgi:hypothetical protein